MQKRTELHTFNPRDSGKVFSNDSLGQQSLVSGRRSKTPEWAAHDLIAPQMYNSLKTSPLIFFWFLIFLEYSLALHDSFFFSLFCCLQVIPSIDSSVYLLLISNMNGIELRINSTVFEYSFHYIWIYSRSFVIHIYLFIV